MNAITPKSAAALIALVAGMTLITRVVLKTHELGGLGQALGYLAHFFTILTNTLVLVMMLLLARGASLSGRWLTAVVVAITCVGLVYHVALAHLVALDGLALLADHGTHTVVPALTVLWWLAFGPRQPVRWFDPLIWVAWPLAYCAYILVLAGQTGLYPYPFLNVTELGYGGVAKSVVLLCGVFVIVGLGLVALRALVSRPK